MDFWITIASLLRSARVIVPTLLIALSISAAVYVAVPMRYASSTTMVLTTTEFGGTESLDPAAPADLTNPMLNFSESLRTTADMLIWSMTSKDVEQTLERHGATEVVVNNGRTNPDLLGFNGPLLYVTAESTDPAEVQAVVVRASDLMRETLVAWQNEMGAPEKTYITMVDVVAPTAAEPDRGSKVELAALSLLGWIFLGLASAYAVTRRRARRALTGRARRGGSADLQERGEPPEAPFDTRPQRAPLRVGSP